MEKRPWIVTLAARSSIHIAPSECVQANVITPTGKVTVTLSSLYADPGGFPLWLVASIVGEANDFKHAASTLSKYGQTFFSQAALIGNGFVADPKIISVHDGPDTKAGGRVNYHEIVRHKPQDPPSSYRVISANLLLEVNRAIATHAQSNQLSAICEMFADSLQLANPASRVLSSELLFLCTERLDKVIRERLYDELNIESRKPHDLAVALEVEVINEKGGRDLNKMDAEIRKRYIFPEREQVLIELTDASHKLEHGSSEFAWRDRLHDVFPSATAAIRKAVLEQVQFSKEENDLALSPKFDHPLEGWQPELYVDFELELDCDVDHTQAFSLPIYLGKVEPYEDGKRGTQETTFKVEGHSDQPFVRTLAQKSMELITPVGSGGTMNIKIADDINKNKQD